MLFTSFTTPPLHIISHHSPWHKTVTLEISAYGRSCFLWSVNFLDFFPVDCTKVFRNASWGLMKEQASRMAKSAVVQHVTVFRLILAKWVNHWFRAWDGKASLGASLWAVTKLWPRKVVFRGQIYSARAKLMLISDQSRDLVEIVLKAGICVLFQNGSSTCGILSGKCTCDDLCGKSESYWVRVIWWYFARINVIVPGWLWIVLSVPRTWLIVWFPEFVDRQNSHRYVVVLVL